MVVDVLLADSAFWAGVAGVFVEFGRAGRPNFTGQRLRWWQPTFLQCTHKAMCFFLCFSSLFIHQTYAGARKKNAQRKKKHWLSVPDYLTDKWHTKLIVLSAVILLFIFYHTMIKLNSFQSARKLDFSWYLTTLRRQRTCSNLQPKRSSTLRMHSSCRDRSLDGSLTEV